ncbi:RP1 like 1, transcript variant X3 [Ictidomys tridecemlineatus]|uniref:retinitis pigmentosa 1-like 1 protein n=1 Tax=Ictidomys tridecemlineatus TaxID=43179 RepID=UPI00038BF753|nr:retinitis pigmentosa 1-like 1 protein [Ictidomys tridecemlineatus]XP_021590201.1 retinitis pigmentosa 1-like 1 protein [Ictidomys tridecemlineatus]KAG3294265.1 RP1 like 1, transcript variant X4 [Ictidomys tridecemlineatus]KAG3294266.1 RP1 like 1, transcript variant X2 [Ictidomys tridecemlineatus]KAG3294267.1 RP1 like 1, transcript variant X1 [Ictidomys tridecemlineatus]KAG3294268.1 RP1 like 1, transcript variant X5 [Ictidomys tridecemlineatus]KAG3294269.1 RP1 like 1, transcript variant X3 
MSSSPRDTQGPSHRQGLLPSVTHVPPAKKITFLKRGDARFAGVRLAVHQRSFKTFSALMDELSQRVPLSFGVRSVTTPRGLHGLSALEQLQDGGCYLCSDRKPPKTPSGPGQLRGRSPSALQSRDLDGGREVSGTSSSWKGPRAPRRITLVKNRDPRFQETVVLSHRNTRSLAAFLSKASDLLRFPVRQIYTPSGKKVDSLQALLRGPSTLVCAGNEAFRPPALESAQKNKTETLSGMTSRNKHSCWGPKAKQSVIHLRSTASSRPPQFSLSGLRDPSASLHGAPHRHPQDTSGPLLAGDNVEKKVCMNEDGSLSVEMKVRLHLLGEETLLWSHRAGRAGTLTAASGEGPVLGEGSPLCCRWGGHPWGFSESGAQRPGPCEAGPQGAFDGGQQPRPSFEIWRNPLYVPQGEGAAPWRRSGLAQLSQCRGRWSRGARNRERRSRDSGSPSSSAGHGEGSEPDSCSPRTPEGGVGSDSPCPASTAASQCGDEREAGEGSCPGEAELGGQGQHGCPGPGIPGAKGALSDSLASTGPREESSKWDGQHEGCLSPVRVRTSQEKGSQGSRTDDPTRSLSPLSDGDSQAEQCEQGTTHQQATEGPVAGPPLALGRSHSWDAEGGCPGLLAHAPAQLGRRKRQSPSSAVSSPGTAGVVQRGRARRCHHCRDTHCLPDSPTALQMPRTGPGGPGPQLSQNSPSTRKQASRDLGPSVPGSLDSQDLPEASSASTTLLSNSDCAAELAGDTEGKVCSPEPLQGGGSLGDQAEDTLEPSLPLALPVGCPEGEEPGAHKSCCCPQIGSSPVQGKTSDPAQAAWGPFSEACWVCRGYCPTPPRGRPCSRKHPTSSSSTSSDHQRADDGGPSRSRLGDEKLQVESGLSPGPESGTVGATVMVAGRNSPGSGPKRVLLGTSSGNGGGLEEPREDGTMTPHDLPHSSPDAMVREWLDNIPEEPLHVKHEMVAEATSVVSNIPEGPREDPEGDHSLSSTGEQAQAGRQALEGGTHEPDRTPPGTGDAGSKPGDHSHQGTAPGQASQAASEARVGEGATVGPGMSPCVLPGRDSASMQIMKALMGSKHGRPSSLPEVSSAEARRLRRLAGDLIACLARLHFFDEDLGSPAGKVRPTHSARYQELLNISQTLWPGCGLGRDMLDLSLGDLTSLQAPPVTDNFTPTSSSGVDVSSGSGGSGEGSVPCATDGALVSERTELPLEISQRPDSRTSGHLEDLGTRQPSGLPAAPSSQVCACAASGEGGGGPGEQMLGDGLEPSGKGPEGFVGNTLQEAEAQSEETEETESPPEEGLEEVGLLGEAGVSGEESPGGEGTLGDPGVPGEEAGGDSASAGLCPPGSAEEPAECPRSERDSHASESQTGPTSKSSLEELSRADALGCEPAPARFTPGTGESSASAAHRVFLEPDPAWVSKLLRKIEKAFMKHLATATAELRARWDLQDDPLLDQMVAELEQDMGLRLQESTNRELQKIESRTGRMALGPPREVIRGQASLQTEQRRRRLQGLHNLLAFSEQTYARALHSLTLEDRPTLHEALGDLPCGETEEDEFCPCEACIRKKVAPVPPKDTPGASSAPIKKAFDLQQILQNLQKKKEGGTDGEAEERVPEGTGTELPRDIPARAGSVQDLGPTVGQEREGEGSQRPSRDEDAQLEEAEEAGYQETAGDAEAGRAHGHHGSTAEEAQQLERAETEKEGALGEHSGEGDASEAAGGPGDLVDAIEAQEAGGGRRLESTGGSQGEEEDGPLASPGQGQRREASENSVTDQEVTPPSPAPSEDTPHPEPDPQTHDRSSRTFTLGNCSLVSQKGSEEVQAGGEPGDTGAESEPPAQEKVTSMYPESSTSEREEPPSDPETLEQGSGRDAGEGNEKAPQSSPRAPSGAGPGADGFHQEDLDF